MKHSEKQDMKKNDVGHSKTTIVQRLQEFLEFKGITRNKFYGMSKVSNGAINPEKKDVNSKTIERTMAVFPELNLYWLITGKGEMTAIKEKEQKVESESKELFSAYRKIDRLRDELDAAQDEVKEWKAECKIKDVQIHELNMKVRELEKALSSFESRDIA